jgi:hypothetical protein
MSSSIGMRGADLRGSILIPARDVIVVETSLLVSIQEVGLSD